MNGSVFKDIEKLEADLWSAADNLRANSKLTSSDYFMPVLGIIFLRHAANRYEAATRHIKDDQDAGRMPKRKIVDADYVRRRALPLPQEARYDWIMAQATSGKDPLPKLVTNAMKAIEARFEPLKGVLPKDYGIFEPKVLEDLMRLFNSEQIRSTTGDVFGRIYEYFLAEFSIQKAHDNGEFFTPSSLVQMIVNVIEPNHGKVFDPACGSGGMFVQTSHFIEHAGSDTAKKVVFYGQEKNPDTIHIALMNLAVHGLTGEIAEAITYYEDKHGLVGGADFVMANPPFNVDLVDAERVKTDHRLPFGLPGVNKQKKVSNGNYLWISYFWSYLNKTGRAGFVMSSQASSAGHGEKDVRQRIIETGDVDVMMSIRSNFFYTRTVPCELWFFDRGKPSERRDHILMIDARNVYRKVNRTINDFAPEQMANLSAIVWLYRGQKERFVKLIGDYLAATGAEAGKVGRALGDFEFAFSSVDEVFANVRMKIEEGETPWDDTTDFIPAADELAEAYQAYSDDRMALDSAIHTFRKKHTRAQSFPELRAARQAFEPIAERLRGMVKEIDLIAKLAAGAGDKALDLIKRREEELDGELGHFVFDRRRLAKLLKELDAGRKQTVDQLRHATYFHRQAEWLLDRFPEGKLADVPGLVKLVSRAEIAAADWSLTPGRYVGVAPAEVDEDFDFEQTMCDIHTELADLNQEAVELAAKIQKNFEEMGI
jgi:type I restriction enzyme M protein